MWVGSGFVAQIIFNKYDYKNSVAMTVYSLIVGSVLLLPLVWRRVRTCDLPTKSQLLILGLNWFVSQLGYLYSLLYTSMGTNSAIQATSTIFAFIFSMIVLRYEFRVLSAVGVVVVIGGVLLTSFFMAIPVVKSDELVAPETIQGIVVAIASAASGGLFACLFKKWVKVEQNSGIVFGSFSVVAAVLGIPTIAIFHFAGVQEFQVPCWQAALLTLGDAVLCAVVGNYFYAKCFVYLTPITVAIGLTLTIPVSFVITAGILQTHTYPYQAIIGVVLIFIAVIMVSWDQAKYEKILMKRTEVTTKEALDEYPAEDIVSPQNNI